MKVVFGYSIFNNAVIASESNERSNDSRLLKNQVSENHVISVCLTRSKYETKVSALFVVEK